MSFDKIKAMRNAERFLSQGKIRAAINEYQQVVEHDPRDFSTLNTLGDLYAKNSDPREAVGCFTQVAEHYNTQGFSQKAIAIYNKISRIEPTSMEVSAKLAQLYQSKGSVAEARRHYTALAEHYQSKGQKIEALAIWKQIAELDPNNTDIYLKIAESCWQEEQFDEAAHAFTEAGLRFVRQEKFEAALTTFSRTLEIKKNDLRALKGLVKAQIGLGDTEDAASALEKVLEEQPHNRDILYLLVDCYLEMGNAAAAERAIIKLVEQEPGNYPKFLDLVKIYLKNGDVNSATRILSLASEHLLVGGKSEDFLEWTTEILNRNPEQIEALRLIARYYSWQRNEAGLKEALERLAEAANAVGAFEDERYALSQLILIAPQESGFAKRLQEISTLYGFEAALPVEINGNNEVPQFQNYEIVETEENNEQNGHLDEFSFADVKTAFEFEQNNSSQNGFSQNGSSNTAKEFEFYNSDVETTVVENNFQTVEPEFFEQAAEQFEETTQQSNGKLKPADEHKLHKELDSIEFYISQGYQDLASKSLDELEAEFGWQAEFTNLRRQLTDMPPVEESEFAEKNGKAAAAENTVKEKVFEAEPYVEAKSKNNGNLKKKDFENIEELKNELGFEENADADTNDNYETHYHLATAYKEMGLMEKAIKEFQDAINLVEMNDGTRRFFHCANLLGHCFIEKGMPNLAIMWYQRGLQVASLNDDEKHAIYYELGNAFEAGGETKNSVGYFEKLYAENVDYRDVSQRLEKLLKVSRNL